MEAPHSARGSNPARPDNTRQAGPTSARRLLQLALVAGIVIVLAYFVQRAQPVAGSPWATPASAGWWAWFAHPQEVNGWRRAKPQLLDVYFAPNDTALLLTSDGHVLSSTDEGLTWAPEASVDKPMVAIGVDAMSSALVATGIDGTVWQAEANASPRSGWGPLRKWGVTASSPEHFHMAVAGETVLSSDVQNMAWLRDKAEPALARTGLNGISDVAITTKGVRLAAGWNGTIYRSDASDRSWKPVYRGNVPLNRLQVSNQLNVAVTVGRGGKILESDASGSAWTTVLIPGDPELHAVALAAKVPTALVVGETGTVRRRDAIGGRWMLADSGVGETLSSVALTSDGRIALALGDNGLLLRSDDGGRQWQPSGSYGTRTARWYWCLLGVLGVLCAVRIAWILRKPSVIEASSDGVSADSSVNLARDKLAFAPVATALVKFLRDSATDAQFVLAINARWGMGKSSFMKMMRERFADEGVRAVWFNVWHHQHEPVLLAPLLQAIERQAVPRWLSPGGITFRVRLIWRRCTRHSSATWGVWSGVVALGSLAGYLVSLMLRRTTTEGLFWPEVDRFVRDISAVLGLLTGGEWLDAKKLEPGSSQGFWDFIAAAVMTLSQRPAGGWLMLAAILLVVCWFMLFAYLLRPFPASPATLLASFNTRFSVAQAEKQSDFRMRFRGHFNDVAHALQPRTMVVFIDDLDRCNPEKAAELLEAVSFLVDAGPCYVILGMAREIVEAQVASAHKPLAEELGRMARAKDIHGAAPGMAAAVSDQNDRERLLYARKYLRKLIQLDVRLPAFTSDSAQRLLTPSNLERQRGRDQDAHRQARKRWLVMAARQGAVFALSCAFLFQIAQTAEHMEDDVQQKALFSKVRAQVSQKRQAEAARKSLDLAYQHEAWLRCMAGGLEAAGAKPATGPACKPLTDLATTRGGKAMSLPVIPQPPDTAARHYAAGISMVRLHTASLQTALTALEHSMAKPQNKQDPAALNGVSAAVNVLDGYLKRPLPDGRTWQSGDVTSSSVGTSPGSRQWQSPWSTGTADMAPDVSPKNWWSDRTLYYPLGGCALIVLLMFLARDRYVGRPTPQYQNAAKIWAPLLALHGDTCSPREMKRFTNLSRYLVARLITKAGSNRTSWYDSLLRFLRQLLRAMRSVGTRNEPPGPDGTPPIPQNHASVLSEARIVELTAKWLIARLRGAGLDMREVLRQAPLRHMAVPDWSAPSEEEIDAFLASVQELGTEDDPITP